MSELQLPAKKENRWWRWVILASLVLMVLLVPFPARAETPTERTIHIEASRFEYTPGIIKVNPGDHVTIELVSMDVVHSLSLDGYGLQVTADPGKTARLSFVADRAGTFRFHCTTTCGNLHPFMTGKLMVGGDSFLVRAIGLMGLALLAGVWMGRK